MSTTVDRSPGIVTVESIRNAIFAIELSLDDADERIKELGPEFDRFFDNATNYNESKVKFFSDHENVKKTVGFLHSIADAIEFYQKRGEKQVGCKLLLGFGYTSDDPRVVSLDSAELTEDDIRAIDSTKRKAECADDKDPKDSDCHGCGYDDCEDCECDDEDDPDEPLGTFNIGKDGTIKLEIGNATLADVLGLVNFLNEKKIK